MKPKFYHLIILASVTTLLYSCKSASKLYNEGNYDEAVAVAAKKLQKKPGDEDIKAILQNAYHYAVADHENRIAGYSSTPGDQKYEWIYNEYAELQNLYNCIYRVPAVFELVDPVDYSIELNNSREKAGDTHVARGNAWMKLAGRDNAKKAALEFQQALAFLPGNIRVQQLLATAVDEATVRVLIAPFVKRGFQFSSFDNAEHSPANKMISSLLFQSGNEFVKFYSGPEARSGSIENDQVLEWKLNDLSIGRVQADRHTRPVTKEVVVKEIVYNRDSVVKVLGTVKATITTTRRSLVSGASLDILVRDYMGNVLWRDNIYDENKWTTAFSTFTGDERALSEEDKHLINRGPDNIPGDAVIIEGITEKIFNNALNRIKDYYSRY